MNADMNKAVVIFGELLLVSEQEVGQLLERG
jgi:hypothetical protein